MNGRIWYLVKCLSIYLADLFVNRIASQLSVNRIASRSVGRWIPRRGRHRFSSPFCWWDASRSLQTVVRFTRPHHSILLYIFLRKKKWCNAARAVISGEDGVVEISAGAGGRSAGGGLRRWPGGEEEMARRSKIRIVLCVKYSQCDPKPYTSCYCCQTLPHLLCFRGQQECWDVCPSRWLHRTRLAAGSLENTVHGLY